MHLIIVCSFGGLRLVVRIGLVHLLLGHVDHPLQASVWSAASVLSHLLGLGRDGHVDHRPDGLIDHLRVGHVDHSQDTDPSSPPRRCSEIAFLSYMT